MNADVPPPESPIDAASIHAASTEAGSTEAVPPVSGLAVGTIARRLGCGLCMGTADAVPGVSGGTIALILGIYDEFIGSLADAVSWLRSPRDSDALRALMRALVFLVPLAVGVGTAYLVATKLLVGALPKFPAGTPAEEIVAALATDPPTGWLVHPDTAPMVFAFFFGLVLLSIPEPWRAKQSTKGIDWLLALAGASVAVALSLSPPGAGSTSPAALVGSGAVAISVMLLPGVSGSLALLVLGMYQIVSGAVHSKEFDVIAWFLLGIVIGVALFVPLLQRLLKHAHDRTMSVLSGMMAGSLAALWPWKAHYLPKFIPYLGGMSLEVPGSAQLVGPIVSAAVGATLIVGVSKMARRDATPSPPA